LKRGSCPRVGGLTARKRLVRLALLALMPGRTRKAKPGEPTCGVDGCERPAGFAAATPGVGPCLRHGGRAPQRVRASAIASPADDPGSRGSLPLRRLRGPGRPTPDVYELLRLILAAGRDAEFTFEEAWTVALEAVLAYQS